MPIRTLLLILFILPSFVNAQWDLLSKSYLGHVYLDFSTSERKGPFFFVWQLQDFYVVDKTGIRSRRILNKINCKTKERQILYSSSHSEHMGKGVVIISGKIASEWEEPLPKSVGARLVAEVCG